MMFLPKVNVFNRKYEIDFNEDVDNGNISHFNFKGRIHMGSLNNSFAENNKKEKSKKEEKDESEGGKLVNESDEIIIDRVKGKNTKDTGSTTSNTFTMDDNAIRFVEEFGFKREFIIKSLENNEINHATATYYLKMSLLNE